VRLGREVEDLVVGNGLGTGQAPGPDLREGGHHAGAVNLLLTSGAYPRPRAPPLAQEQGAWPGAVEREGGSVEELGHGAHVGGGGDDAKRLGARRGAAAALRARALSAACVACGALTESEGASAAPAGARRVPGRDARLRPLRRAAARAGRGGACDDCLRRPALEPGPRRLPYRGTGAPWAGAQARGPDRPRPAAGLWLAAAARPLLVPGQVIVPVPLHWTRLLCGGRTRPLLAARGGAALGLPSFPTRCPRGAGPRSSATGDARRRAKPWTEPSPHPAARGGWGARSSCRRRDDLGRDALRLRRGRAGRRHGRAHLVVAARFLEP
jgi:hypothetical protein